MDNPFFASGYPNTYIKKVESEKKQYNIYKSYCHISKPSIQFGFKIHMAMSYQVDPHSF